MSLRLALSYSYMPNSLGYCGNDELRKALKGYLAEGKHDAIAKKHFKSLKAHFFYLRMLSLANACGLHDREVVEAFWQGNGLLDCWFEKRAPRIPFHMHHVLKFGSFSGRVNKTVKEKDMCRISWGKVIRVDGRKVRVKTQRLERIGGSYRLAGPVEKTWVAEHGGLRIVGPLKNGDWVSSHWGFVVKKLAANEKKNLEKYSKMTMEAVNASGDAVGKLLDHAD